MQEKELHKLGKTDLLTIIYKQEKQIQRLTKEVEELKQQLDDRTIQIKEAGSIAEASLKINKIFEVAQQAADEYLRSIKEVNKPSHECAEIQGKTSKDKANTENQNELKSENTYEKITNEKVNKELILVNNKIMLPKTKLLKKVLVLLAYLGTIISGFVIAIIKNTVIVTKKAKLCAKINFIKLKCRIFIIKNYILLILKKIKKGIITFSKLMQKLLINIAKNTKHIIRRSIKKTKCRIEKTKRFSKKKIKEAYSFTKKVIKFIGRTIKFSTIKTCKLLKKVYLKIHKKMRKYIQKCKVRLIVFKFKIRNKKAFKIKLIEQPKVVANERVDEAALVIINNKMTLYKIGIFSYIKKYLKILKVILLQISNIAINFLKKVIKLLKIVVIKISIILKKIFSKIVTIIKKVYMFLSKKMYILKMKFISKIKHTKLINEINDHIHIEETKDALIQIKTDVKPFKQKITVKIIIILKKVKAKIIILSLKVAKKVLIISNIARRKLIIIFKKLKRKLIKTSKKAINFIKKTILKIRNKIKERKVIRQMSKDTHTAIIKNLQISMPYLEKELKRRKQKSLKLAFIKTLSFSAMVVVAFAIITSTSFFKILQVSGTSMQPTLNEGELLITSKFFKYEKGDMVAFYYNDSVLIKRVIATENDIVNIEYDGTVYVNSVKLEENYVKELNLGNCDITFPYQVPKNSVFILGDNRKDSIDSRSKSLGSISTDKIIGKIQFRLNPFVIY